MTEEKEESRPFQLVTSTLESKHLPAAVNHRAIACCALPTALTQPRLAVHTLPHAFTSLTVRLIALFWNC